MPQTVEISDTVCDFRCSPNIPDTVCEIRGTRERASSRRCRHPRRCFRVSALGWSHYVTLLAVTNPDARRVYEIEAADNGWSVRELKRQLDSSLYERLALSRDKPGPPMTRDGVSDFGQRSVVLEFAWRNGSRVSHGSTGFKRVPARAGSTTSRARSFRFDDSQPRRLVFYNRLLRCYVLIDLKRGKLTHQDLGQMQMYVNYFDRYVKTDDELPTVGILLCDRKKDAIVELTLPEDANIYASKYQLYLPSKQELAEQLAMVRREVEAG